MIVGLICCAVALPFSIVLRRTFAKSDEPEFPELQARVLSYRNRIVSYLIVSYRITLIIPYRSSQSCRRARLRLSSASLPAPCWPRSDRLRAVPFRLLPAPPPVAHPATCCISSSRAVP